MLPCILLGSLCTTVFYFGGNFAGTILFHNTDAGLYIRTLSFICPFLYTNIALTSILNGLGKTGTTLVHSVLGILLRISFVIFAIPVLGIRGYLYGLLLSEILLSLLHIYALYHYGILAITHGNFIKFCVKYITFLSTTTF